MNRVVNSDLIDDVRKVIADTKRKARKLKIKINAMQYMEAKTITELTGHSCNCNTVGSTYNNPAVWFRIGELMQVVVNINPVYVLDILTIGQNMTFEDYRSLGLIGEAMDSYDTVNLRQIHSDALELNLLVRLLAQLEQRVIDLMQIGSLFGFVPLDELPKRINKKALNTYPRKSKFIHSGGKRATAKYYKEVFPLLIEKALSGELYTK